LAIAVGSRLVANTNVTGRGMPDTPHPRCVVTRSGQATRGALSPFDYSEGVAPALLPAGEPAQGIHG